MGGQNIIMDTSREGISPVERLHALVAADMDDTDRHIHVRMT
jgi:hypothetical protein